VSIVVLHKDKILGFHAEDPHSKQEYFFLPGGVPEEGEELSAAATREVLEETGYEISVSSKPSLESHYDFEWDGKSFSCQTHYFLGELKSETSSFVKDAPYHRGVDWRPTSEIERVFSYHPEILNAVQSFAGELLESFKGIDFFRNRKLLPNRIADLYEDSGLNRPTKDLDRIARMFEHSNLVISAWRGEKLVGVSRALTDFSYCCYLSDLAISKVDQRGGLGKKLIDLTKKQAGPESNLLLLSSPEAMEYYPKVGLDSIQNGFFQKRSR
jgi:8-oxo-dGTP pyrophosphatase MutT (NUDIX family)